MCLGSGDGDDDSSDDERGKFKTEGRNDCTYTLSHSSRREASLTIRYHPTLSSLSDVPWQLLVYVRFASQLKWIRGRWRQLAS